MIIIFILTIVGFINAFYLYYQHRREVATGQKMFCLIGGDCGAVVGSGYGRTFGIKNELIGMFFYAAVATFSLTSIFLSNFGKDWLVVAKLITMVAVVFSLYLLYAQTIILRKFCSWCLVAIFINLLIFYFLWFS